MADHVQDRDRFMHELLLLFEELDIIDMSRQLRRRSTVNYTEPGPMAEVVEADTELRTLGTDSMSVEEVRQHLHLHPSQWARLRETALAWMTAQNSRRANECVGRRAISGPGAEERRAAIRDAMERCALEFLEEGGAGEVFFGTRARRSADRPVPTLIWPADRTRLLDLIIKVLRNVVHLHRRRQGSGGVDGFTALQARDEDMYEETGESSAAMDDNPSNGDGAAGPSSGTQGTVMTELPLRGRATTLSDFDDEVKREPDSDSELPMPPAWLQAWPISLHITLFSSAAAVPTIPSSSDSEPRRKPGNFGSRLFPRNVTTTYMCPTYDDLVWHIRQYHQRTTAKRQRYSRSAGTATTGSDDLVNFTIRARLPGSPPIIHDDHSYWEAVGNVREAEWMDDTLKLAVLVELPPDTLGDSI